MVGYQVQSWDPIHFLHVIALTHLKQPSEDLMRPEDLTIGAGYAIGYESQMFAQYGVSRTGLYMNLHLHSQVFHFGEFQTNNMASELNVFMKLYRGMSTGLYNFCSH